MTFWTDRNTREKWLIGVAGALFAIVILWMGILTPVMNAHASAVTEQEIAARDLDIVRISAPNSGTVASAAPLNRAGLIAIARQRDIALSRVQPQGSDALTVWLDDIATARLYGFLDVLIRENNAEVQRLTINREADGVVSAQITFKVAG